MKSRIRIIGIRELEIFNNFNFNEKFDGDL